MAYEDLVQPNVIVMQYSFNKPSQETQVPQSSQEVTSEFRSNFLSSHTRMPAYMILSDTVYFILTYLLTYLRS
jgi:hypothetical protein